MKVHILVGTMTGTAQLCAQEMELALDDGETQVSTLMMDALDSSVFSREGVFLICVFGLGDRTYAETFNFGGKRFDELLSELGAQRIGERHKHDASSGVLPEETALEWCQEWLAKVKQRVAAS